LYTFLLFFTGDGDLDEASSVSLLLYVEDCELLDSEEDSGEGGGFFLGFFKVCFLDVFSTYTFL
jgi:hypothetical protein